MAVDKNVIKRLLNMDTSEGSDPVPVLDDIIALVEAQLKNRLGGADTIPAQLEYIVVNVTVARFNQIGDEGKSSMTIEGESASWLTDLFQPFEADIQRYVNSSVQGGKITFL